MVTWFLNLLQGDFASNPTAWIDLLITIAGIVAAPITWFINSRKAKKDAETAQRNFDKQLDAIRGQRDEARRQAEAQAQLVDSLKAQVDSSAQMVNALRDQVTQLAEANRITSVNNPEDLDPWGDSEWENGEMFRIKNCGPRTVIVENVRGENEASLIFDRPTPFDCQHGDSVEYMAVGTSMGRPATIIEWHFEGSDETRTTRRSNFKPRR